MFAINLHIFVRCYKTEKPQHYINASKVSTQKLVYHDIGQNLLIQVTQSTNMENGLERRGISYMYVSRDRLGDGSL